MTATGHSNGAFVPCRDIYTPPASSYCGSNQCFKDQVIKTMRQRYTNLHISHNIHTSNNNVEFIAQIFKTCGSYTNKIHLF